MAKSNKTTSTNGAEAALNAAQVIFNMNPASGPQNKHFWQAQDRFLQEAEKFSAAWFKRRHEATRAALETVQVLTKEGMSDPAKAMNAIAEWQRQSMERLADDAKDCTEMMTRCVGSAISNEIEAIEEVADTTKRATTHTSMPV